MRISIIIFFLFVFSGTVLSKPKSTLFSPENYVWADSLLATLSLEEKIGQLIMVTSVPEQGVKNEKQIEKWITNQHIGGVLFLKTTPYALAVRAKNYQNSAKVPLFIAIDGENGLSFRLDSVVHYPYAMGLGALNNDSLLYRMGREVGQQCKTLGINLNFAPVADVNSNPENPVINYRSFGENPYKVSEKCWQFAHGMQDENLLVTAKHFPGHGDTGYDSHQTLPVINKNYNELNSLELIPFRRAVKGGINGIMSAHISLPLIDNSRRPATLSEKIMTRILRDSIGFDGLVFSDGMNMKGITNTFSEADAAVKALKSGVDVLEFVLDPARVIRTVARAVRKGIISEATVNNKCRKVLLAKAWTGAKKNKLIKLNMLTNDLNKSEYRLTARYLFEQSLTVLQNHDSILPLQRLDTLKIAVLSVGDSSETVFQKRLNDYMHVDQFNIDLNDDSEEIAQTIKELSNYNLVITGIHGTHLSKRNKYGVTALHQKSIQLLTDNCKTILVFFSNPYALGNFEHLNKSQSIVVTYGDNEILQDAAAQLVFGAIGTAAKLPVTISSEYPEGTGMELKKTGRLKYTIPEEVGFDSQLLNSKIDSFATFGIKDTIFPGCQILVAKDGKVVVDKSYGYYTYDSILPVSNQSLYDWASITKIVGPLPWLMKMVEDSILMLDEPFSRYWPYFMHTDKAAITLREILAHQAGFKEWIPFNVSDNPAEREQFKNRMLNSRPSSNYPVRVSTDLYANKMYKSEMMNEIARYKIDKRKKYHYSDIGFYLFPDLISRFSCKNYETLVSNEFLAPIGASDVFYNPYKYLPKELLVPTELDETFRKQLIQGFVHDESAALLGGISGNAGLFGNANDLAKIMQLYLNYGTYGDFKFLSSETIKEFTRIQYPKNENRRGLGFDKPYIDNAKKKLADAYPATSVSSESFGHSGFTGTFVWADPVNHLIFIFLSNRVYPSRTNNKLVDLNFRPELQQTIYNCQNSFHYYSY